MNTYRCGSCGTMHARLEGTDTGLWRFVCANGHQFVADGATTIVLSGPGGSPR